MQSGVAGYALCGQFYIRVGRSRGRKKIDFFGDKNKHFSKERDKRK